MSEPAHPAPSRAPDGAALPAGQIARIARMEEGHFWYAGRLALVERLVRARVSPGARVLDAGCGTGSTAARLRDLGYDVSAADLSADAVPACAAKGIAAFTADARHLPFETSAFHAVLLLDVIEHTDDAAALREAARVLAPGGVVVLTVPACPRLWSARDEVAGHLRRYSRRSLLAAIHAGGLLPAGIGHFGTLLFPAFAASRMLARTSPGALAREERQPGWLARPLRAVALLEARLAGVVHLPYGSSLYAVCRKGTA